MQPVFDDIPGGRRRDDSVGERLAHQLGVAVVDSAGGEHASVDVVILLPDCPGSGSYDLRTVRGHRPEIPDHDEAHLHAAATPLPFLGYLIDETAQAVVIGGSGVLVNVPRPGRFALHELWLSRQRPVAEQVKVRRDVQQASHLLEVLLADRPQEIRDAWAALARSTRERRVVEQVLGSATDAALVESRALLG